MVNDDDNDDGGDDDDDDYDDDDDAADYYNDLLLNTSACYSPDLTLTLADNPAEVCYNHAG